MSWIEKAEEHYNAKYVGLYDFPNREGPFYVFFQKDIPEQFKGDDRYDNYLALIWRGEHLYVTGAKPIRDAVFSAIEYEPGKFICSRFRHNYVTAPNGAMLDGGLAYLRCTPVFMPTHTMRIVDGEEVFEPILKGDACA